MNIENVSDNELNEIKAFIRGLVAGIKDTNKNHAQILDDYWYAWDNTIEINIWLDESAPEKYLATLYSVWNNSTDYENFQRLDYLIK